MITACCFADNYKGIISCPNNKLDITHLSNDLAENRGLKILKNVLSEQFRYNVKSIW